jgi:polyisoprenoid-binding protein YceI
MTRYDANQADCHVFTFKEGLLSPIAHDLKIRVTSFAIEVDEAGRSVKATFDATSLRVVCAQKDGIDEAGLLGDADRRKIESNILNDVLHAGRHPEARFESTRVEERDGGYRVEGRLTLHGRERPIACQVKRQGDRLVGEIRLDQPEFGIKPYTAAFGTLRVQAAVTVRVSIPAF